jgi:MFS family permease
MDAMGTPCYRGPAGRPYDARVRRLIALVCVLIVFDLALWSAVVPLLPYYRHALGLSTLQTAWILAAFSLAVIVVAVPMGHLADRIGPRLVTAIGTVAMAVATAGLALATSFPQLMVARVFQGAADAAVWGAGLAWVAARAPVERRGEAVGYAQVAATIGVITGPFIGGVVTTTFGIRPTFLGMTALFTILLVLIALEPDARIEDHRRTGMISALRASLGESLITASVSMILVVALVGGALQLLVPLHLSSLGVDRSGIGLVYSVGAVLGAGVVIITARVGDRVGRVPLATGACAALAVLTACFALPAGIAVFVGLVIACSGAQSILYAVGYPLSTDGADRAQLGHGVVLGVVNLMWGIGAVVGPVAGSRLAGWQGTRASYALLAVVCAATAVMFVRVQRGPASPSSQVGS